MSLRALLYNCRPIRFLTHMESQYGISREASSFPTFFFLSLLLFSPHFNSHSNFNNCKSGLISQASDIHFYLVEDSNTLRDPFKNAPLKKNLLKCIYELKSLSIQQYKSLIFLKWSLAFEHTYTLYQSHMQFWKLMKRY